MLKPNDRGFLLFEVMVAVVVLAVGLTLVLRSFNSAIATVKGLQDYTTAMFLLEEKMFQLETEGVEDEGKFENEFNNFSWKIDFIPIEEAALDKIEVSILWNTANTTKKF